MDEVTKAPTPSSSEQIVHQVQRLDRLFQVLAAIMLALVALGTAWSGYQAARWSGVQAAMYVGASAQRVLSSQAATRGGQLSQIDIALFSNWINAYAADDEKLVEFYQKRFRAEFVPAFDAWLATDPANNPDAPPSPFAMPEYQLAANQEAAQLAAEAERLFNAGQNANQISDDYVLNTVILAAALFFLAIAERFDWLPVRVFVLIVAFALLAFVIYRLGISPIE